MRDLFWVGSSSKDLGRFPEDVKDRIGYGLHMAQTGALPDNAKVVKGFAGASVQEIVDNDDGSTYRAVYTAQLKSGLYVLHCFQKKGVRGIKTLQPDIDMIKARL